MLPFRVFGIVARRAALPQSSGVLFWNCLSFRVPVPMKHRPYGLGVPTVPLAFSSAMWFFLIGLGRLLFRVTGRTLSSSFTFL